ncbi:hypothetical protein CEE37_09975 [candidate division LCP-89 bacterium B3_LCP]|uniref:Uncharacterized protein n=1 Tax=candidate division LCP-89 bacterium B3_LCP TaxID=2012998 RepID=A0A532UYL9_UNCL8|nr:MAG: hypothetical protein CEE37_09975 [candidate division LCP-89 bacterium B3_LCP]
MNTQNSSQQSFLDWIRSLDQEIIDEIHKKQHEAVLNEYKGFEEKFGKGICYICDSELSEFQPDSPCVHWLLAPVGFRKKHFKDVYNRFGFYRIQAFLRWVANTEIHFQNINDLVEEHSGKKKIDLTISFRNLRWSFSCSHTDFKGHGQGLSAVPHYHFQMYVDNKHFIKYRDFHIPFGDEDLFKINIIEDNPDVIGHKFSFGEGMQDLLDSTDSDELIRTAVPSDKDQKGTVHIQTLISSEEGIAWEDVEKLMKEAKDKNVTFASLAHKLGEKTIKLIEPGPAVPQTAERKGGRGSKSKKK